MSGWSQGLDLVLLYYTFEEGTCLCGARLFLGRERGAVGGNDCFGFAFA